MEGNIELGVIDPDRTKYSQGHELDALPISGYEGQPTANQLDEALVIESTLRGIKDCHRPNIERGFIALDIEEGCIEAT